MSQNKLVKLEQFIMHTETLGDLTPMFNTETNEIMFGVRFDAHCKVSADLLEMEREAFKQTFKSLLVERIQQIKEKADKVIDEIRHIV